MKSTDFNVNENSYWLYLHPYVYTSIKKNHAIIYNTVNHKLIEKENSKKILKIIKRLNSNKNLYVIRLSRKDFDDNIYKFIMKIKENFMGDLMNTSYSLGKPIQFKPILTLQTSFERLTTVVKAHKILEKDKLKDYLNSIYLYINDQCSQSCEMCKNAFRQFPYCHKTNNKNEIEIENINMLLNEVKGSKLYKISILGGNIFKHSQFRELLETLNRNHLKKEYFIHYLNIINKENYLDIMNNKNSYLNILIHFPLDEDVLKESLTTTSNSKINFTCSFVVKSSADVETAENIISKNKVKNFCFLPYFNRKNVTFFKKYVFINKKAILDSFLTMNDLFARKVLNSYSFRNLTILSNKEIYANINNPTIGELGKDNLFNVIAKELNTGKSWFKVRKNVNPCKSCVYNELCPPISNYEYVIGKYNLCNMWKK